MIKASTRILFLLCFLLTFLVEGMCQDTLYLPNGNFINGEIKGMEQGLLKIDTDYGDQDFVIEWDQVKQIYTSTYFFVSKNDGTIHYGWLRSDSVSTLRIIGRNGQVHTCDQLEIAFLRELNKGFASRLSAGFDVGLDLTKANNMRKGTASANLGYQAKKWNGQVFGSVLSSTQDETKPIRRYEVQADYRYIFFKGWALDPSINLLSSTEQSLDLRSSFKLGIGKFLMRKTYGYWGIGAGVNRNMEQYSNETPDRYSWEGYFGTEVKLFDVRDLEFFTNATAFPSFTEKKRWRADFNFSIKYDLPLDFYVKLNYTVNYDNRPAEGADEADYVLRVGVGWSW